jgi:glucose/mannose-6-phosphate isomerase
VTSLDDLKALRCLDKSDMLGRAAALGSQCRWGWEQGLNFRLPRSFQQARQLLMLGVGGSAIGAELLQGIVEGRLRRPIHVNRTYTVPAWVGRDTLGVICSYSGNTEETLTAAREAIRRGAKVMAITSGGRLAAWGGQAGFPVLLIPAGFPPRAAIGYQLFAPLGILVRLGWLEARQIPAQQSWESVGRTIRQRLIPSVRTTKNPAKRIALRIQGRIPILYGASGGWEGLTYRWRTQLEENAKTLATHHLFPEATHNEISGWLQPRPLMKRLIAIFLTDPAVHPRIRRRMEFTAQIIRREGAQVLTLDGKGAGRSTLSRTLGLIALGDFVSIYLGLLYQVDPTPVERVEALKKWLR